MDLDPDMYHCAICLIRECPVETLSVATVTNVVERGRPTPALPLLSKECRYKGKAFTRRFKKENYLRYDWLAGCDVENKLFCWPCYIFSSDPTDTWGFKGFDGLSNFSNSVKTHTNQELHLLNVEKYNCYAPNECKIWCERAPSHQSSTSYPVGRKKADVFPTTTVVKQTPEEEEEEDDFEIIRHSDVTVEILGDEERRDTGISSKLLVVMANASAYHCIVCTLTKIPFASLSKESQQKIVKSGRPTNQMPNLHARCQNSMNLNVYNWMTGCDKNQRLYCWPCLLFNTSDYDTWGKQGFTDFHRLSQATLDHTKDVSHQAKSKTLKLWMETSSDVSDDSSEEELECIPELDFLDSNVPEEEEELDIKPNVEALIASSSSSSQQAVTAILDLCDPAGVKEIEVARTSPILIRDISPDPAENVSSEDASVSNTPNTINAIHTTVAASQEYEIAKIYRVTGDMSQSTGAGAEKYQLKWHSHQQNLNSSISCLYKNDRYADVMLITCNNEENFAIPAHKLVLGTSSAYFANIFDKNIAPLNAMTYIVLPPELTRRAIQTLIQYMYTGESTVSVDILNEVLRGGDILKIRGLWRNQSGTDTAATSEHAVPKDVQGRHRTERISVDRVPLQEPRIAQNPVTIHDSPVIVTNSVKSYGISQTAQMPASSSTPIINVKKDVAIDPGEKCTNYEGYLSTKRIQPVINQENNHQIPRQQNTPKTSSPRSVLSNTENVPSPSTGAQAMPEELNFLNVKAEPVEWTDVNADEINLDKSGLTMVKVEMKESSNADGCLQQSQEQVYSPLTCELCSETFTVPAEWVRHIESHTDPPHTVSKRRRRIEDDEDTDITAALKCDLCAMYFVTPAEWVRHVQSTHTETELAMSNNSSFPRRVAKSASSDSHHSMLPTAAQLQEKTCSVCNKGFPSYASMIIHKRTHTGERPFYCDICNKGFNVKSNLLRHMRTLHNQQGSQSPTQGDPDSHGSD